MMKNTVLLFAMITLPLFALCQPKDSARLEGDSLILEHWVCDSMNADNQLCCSLIRNAVYMVMIDTTTLEYAPNGAILEITHYENAASDTVDVSQRHFDMMELYRGASEDGLEGLRLLKEGECIHHGLLGLLEKAQRKNDSLVLISKTLVAVLAACGILVALLLLLPLLKEQ